jgi:hypothetical protein
MADEKYLPDEERLDDGIQHGIDDDPNNDAAKGAVLGGVGGAAVGAAAGSMLGPGGAIVGGLIGGAVGAGASGAAVGAIDQHDNDDKMTGIGEGVDRDIEDRFDDDEELADTTLPPAVGATYPATGTVYDADDNRTRPIT